MRFILTILLFLSQGQIINASAPYRPLGCSGLLLDCVPNGVGAYSLRKIKTSYSGNCIRVRRSSDNTEQDIGFTASGDLDTATLKTFVGANNGFVVTWYTQEGSNNATQTTNALQPRIITAGTVLRVNGKPTILFDESIPTGLVFTATTYTHTAIVARSTTIVLVNYVLTNTSVGLYWSGTAGDVTGIGGFDGTNVRNSTTENTNINVAFFSMRSSSLFITVNGGSESNTGAFATSLSPTRIGGRGNLGISHTGNISEIIMWNSNVSGSSSTVLSNINSYYSIY